MTVSLEDVPTPLLICDVQGRVLESNSRAKHLLGSMPQPPSLDQILDFSRSDLGRCESFKDVVANIRDRKAAHTVISLRHNNPPVSHLRLHFSFREMGANATILVVIQDVSDYEKLIDASKYKESVLDSIIATSNDALVAFDDSDSIELFSPAAERMFGKSSAEMLIEDVYSLFHVESQERVREVVARLKSQGPAEDPLSVEDIRPLNPDGESFPASISFSKSKGQYGSLFFMMISDKSVFHRFVNSVNDAYIKTDAHGYIIDINRKTEALFHHDSRALLGRHISFLGLRSCATSDVVTDVAQLAGAYAEDEDFTAFSKYGDELSLNLTVWPQDFKNVQLNNLIIRDVSSKKLAERQLVVSAYTDSLTQLANRAKFSQSLHGLISERLATERQIALIIVDLDSFKEVNDAFGHDYGDDLLRISADRLTGCVRNHDLICRMGGDEFAIIIKNVESIPTLDQIVERILTRFRESFSIKGKHLSVSASIGIAVFPRDGNTAEALYKAADMSMYAAKRSGKNCYRHFTQELYEQYERQKSLERALVNAVDNGELSLHFQPKISYSQAKLVGFEALLRWQHPELGNISPAEFIPIAEDSGLIGSITRWVLTAGIQEMKRWERESEIFRAYRPTLAVNISADHFRYDILGDLQAALLSEQFDPTLLEIEITESVVLSHTSGAAETLNRIRELGVHVSLDDFGTGYSSLQYLKYFRLNTIKIDRSFVRDIQKDDYSLFIIESIISVAKRLNLNLVAEGVETEQELQRLVSLGCDVFQGYYFSKPLPRGAVLPYLAALHDNWHGGAALRAQ